MVKLACAIVGGDGNVFGVDIDASTWVDDLKKAIKAENEDITCPARKLGLFLAKKGDAWLTESEVKHVTDTNGLKHLSAARAKLRSVGLSDDQVGEADEDEEAAANGPVNVLVVVPPEETPNDTVATGSDLWKIIVKELGDVKSLVKQLGDAVVPREEKTSSSYAVIAATLFQHTFLNVSSTTPSKSQKLKKRLVKKYKCYCGRNQKGDPMLLCMVMNMALPSEVVIASHLFRREHDRLKRDFVQIEDIDDVRNGLLLFKPIESAFDDLDIVFLVEQHDQFTLRIFNPTIKAQLLVDWLTQQEWDVLGGESVPTHWRTSKSPVYAPNAPDFNVLTTFGELDGKTLQFPIGSKLRPFRRCLYHQAQLARTKAITQGWMSEDFNFDDFSSEGFTVEEKMKLLFSSTLSISGSPS